MSLILAGHRWYSPNLMRWTSRDPISFEGGENVYGYVEGEPVGSVDPDGLQSEELNREGSPVKECISRCLKGVGGEYVLDAVLVACPFASIPYPGNKQLLGSTNPYTSLWSMTARSLGLGGAARALRPLNPVSNLIAGGGSSYLGGAAVGCLAVCNYDNNYW